MRMDYAERARALVGIRFRLQGRRPDGLDCVGVVIAAFGLEKEQTRRDYSLRCHDQTEIETALSRYFRSVALHSILPGDVLLMSLGDERLHLGIRTPAGFVHAHAGIGRVVETPGAPEWRVLGAYRKQRD